MKSIYIFLCISFLLCNLAIADDERQLKKQQLDAICEKARLRKLIPARQEQINECVAEGKDRGKCQRFYSDYGDATATRGPLFYEIPECVEAFEYRNSYRSTD